MLSRSDALNQITRLAQYGRDFAVMADDGIEVLIDAIKMASLNKSHAEKIIDTWTREQRWMPTAADIYAVAERVYDRPEPPSSRYQCRACSGTGWQPIWTISTRRGEGRRLETKPIPFETWEKLRYSVDGFNQRVDEGVTACDCEYGCRLANAREVQRQKEAADQPLPKKRKGDYF